MILDTKWGIGPLKSPYTKGGFPSSSAVKNLPAMQETQKMSVWSLGWEDPLEKEMETHSNIPFQKTPMNKGAWWATVHGGHKELDSTEPLSTHTHTHTHTYINGLLSFSFINLMVKSTFCRANHIS